MLGRSAAVVRPEHLRDARHQRRLPDRVESADEPLKACRHLLVAGAGKAVTLGGELDMAAPSIAGVAHAGDEASRLHPVDESRQARLLEVERSAQLGHPHGAGMQPAEELGLLRGQPLLTADVGKDVLHEVRQPHQRVGGPDLSVDHDDAQCT
jgi:hypothetical protein